MDLKAVSTGPATGVILESRMTRGMGPVSTVIVQSGELNVGDVILAGSSYGKIKKMFSTDIPSADIRTAGPSMPVNVRNMF